MFKQWLSVDVTEGRAIAAIIGAAIAPWVSLIYGNGRLIPIVLLIVVIALDWITGISAALKDKTFSSEYGLRQGVPRTLFLFALPALANLLDAMLGVPGLLFYAITLGIIYHTWQSLTANAYRAGWGKWIPQSVMSHIESELKNKVDRASKNKSEFKGGNENVN
ncbi:phage holin family protein [Paenibacillus sp. NRS-1760]|uniref:phage holin family protein n=1 Tax=Paenibacillus sp. NRS-1760 TaxID=3233902 RepID=UPI003D2CE19A